MTAQRRMPFTVAQASAWLSVSPRRVRAMIDAGKLRAIKIGTQWLIDPDDLAAVEQRRPGRPRKQKKAD